MQRKENLRQKDNERKHVNDIKANALTRKKERI